MRELWRSAKEFLPSLGWWWTLIVISIAAGTIGFLQLLVDSGAFQGLEGPLKLPAVAWWLIGYVALIVGSLMAFHKKATELRRIREGALPADFHSELSGPYSIAVQRFTDRLSILYANYARSLSIPHDWRSGIGDAHFPEAGDVDETAMDFAEKVYVPDSDTSMRAFHKRSPLISGVSVEAFGDFHDARREIVGLLRKWQTELQDRNKAREEATNALRYPANIKVLRVLAYLEIALANVLGNENPTARKDPWFLWVSEICAPNG